MVIHSHQLKGYEHFLAIGNRVAKQKDLEKVFKKESIVERFLQLLSYIL